MVNPSSGNAAQITQWNTTSGLTWVRFQEQLDRLIEPLGMEAMRMLAPQARESILDIGCGCGQTTVELAGRVGPQGRVVGVDVSVPMLEVARRRTPPAHGARPEFLELDAESAALGTGVYAAAYSRFGVMFFSDPAAAFANIRAALKRGGRLAFVCWRPLIDNPWMHVPLQAARPLLPALSPADPNAPGPFAFANEDRVRSILAAAGFASIAFSRHDTRIGGADAEQTVNLALRVGPLGAALREHPDCEAAAAVAVRDALRAYATPHGVWMPASTWVVCASAG
jgi:SAM-dependent methyltransferase